MSVWKIIQFWVCYFLPFFPAVPRWGRVEEADCIFVQAFGRGFFPDKKLVKLLGEFIGSCDKDSFSALKSRNHRPGKSNMALAREVMRIAELYHLPIISQWEVVYAVFWLDEKWYLAHQQDIDCIWPEEGSYFSTSQVKKISIGLMRAHGKSRPLELAHPAMKCRAVMTIWKLGVLPIVESVSPFSFWRHLLWVWDTHSAQTWTKQFLFWLVREIPGRARLVQLGRVGFFPPTNTK